MEIKKKKSLNINENKWINIIITGDAWNGIGEDSFKSLGREVDLRAAAQGWGSEDLRSTTSYTKPENLGGEPQRLDSTGWKVVELPLLGAQVLIFRMSFVVVPCRTWIFDGFLYDVRMLGASAPPAGAASTASCGYPVQPWVFFSFRSCLEPPGFNSNLLFIICLLCHFKFYIYIPCGSLATGYTLVIYIS